MTISSWPWDPDAASGSSITGLQYRELAEAIGATPGVIPGLLNELAVYADSTGMHVKLPSGYAGGRGTIMKSDAEVQLTVPANATGSTRYDAVVIEFDWQNQHASPVYMTGTSATTGPTLNRSLTTSWDVLLAIVIVTNGAATIAALAVDNTKRELAVGNRRELEVFRSTVQSGQDDLNDGSFVTWPDDNTYSNVYVPLWAKFALCRVMIGQVFTVSNNANFWVQVQIGAITSGNKHYNMGDANVGVLQDISFQDILDVTSISGTVVTLRTRGTRNSGSGALRNSAGDSVDSIAVKFLDYDPREQ